MRRIVLLFLVLLIFSASVYAGEVTAPSSAVQRQAADVRVVMYMTSW